MYQFNDQFSKATSQFAEAAASVNRLVLENAEKAFGLQLAAIGANLNATFAFAGQLIEVRDADLSGEWLFDTVDRLLGDPGRLQAMAASAVEAAHPEATAAIAGLVRQLACQQRGN